MKRDNAISFIRVMATLFIIICHLGTHYNSVVIGQFFNVGVPIFFLISGYLYGDKQKLINNAGWFLYKRYLRLEIPALMWLILSCFFAMIARGALPRVHEVVFLLLNLQGLNFIFLNMQCLFIGPWFFTSMMGCYLLFILFRKAELKHPNIINGISYMGGIIPLAVFCLLGFIGISVSGALAFFVGVVLRRKGLIEESGKGKMFVYLAFIFAAIAIRILGKHYFDGTVIYDIIIVSLTHIVLAASIVSVVKGLFAMDPMLMEKIANCRGMRHLDRISIYVYICHTEILNFFQTQIPFFILMPLFICLTILVATILCLIGEWLYRRVDQIVNWLLVTDIRNTDSRGCC